MQRGIASGELRPDTSALALAAVFDSFLSGVSISARDGVDAAVLDAAIDQVMRLGADALPGGAEAVGHCA